MTPHRLVLLTCLTLLTAAGCANFNSGPPVVLSKNEFATLYDDDRTVTDVYYMGSDEKYHHFCMEHWTFKVSGAKGENVDATMDSRKLYLVSIDEFGVKQPFAFTSNQDQWRLLKPREPIKEKMP